MTQRQQLVAPVPLNVAARILRVPVRWLREEILAGRIPGLIAGSRILVHVPTASAVLSKRAALFAEGVADATVIP